MLVWSVGCGGWGVECRVMFSGAAKGGVGCLWLEAFRFSASRFLLSLARDVWKEEEGDKR